MNATLSAKTPPLLIHHFDEVFGVKIPLPALQRGWLHGRELVQPWDAARIAAALGDGCWFSHYARDRDDDEPEAVTLRPYALAGFWPAGGFLELHLRHANPLDPHPRGTLGLYAETPARAEALMAELLAGYRRLEPVAGPQARLGILNHSYGSLSVERIPVSDEQMVSRDRLDLYYGAGMTAWVDDWIGRLNGRRYGLTVLTGAPGTGKTTLLRSLARWLSETHVFYFMPAARFASVEAGEIVTFWAGENRDSKLRKVLILEDAESILLRRAEDNREKVATLLNLTDGMLGDALGLHVVCTLNSELDDIDPALLRPGRLVGLRRFELLTAAQAAALAAVLGVPVPGGERVPLAAVFHPALAPAPERPVAPRRAMGFHTLLPAG